MNQYIKLLETLKEDAEAALTGSWDKGDSGFESQITLIDRVLDLPRLEADIQEDYIAIIEDEKEIVGWSSEEWAQDFEVVFSIANAIKLAYTDPIKLKELLGLYGKHPL
jgi:hypothetical protein